MSTKFVQHLTTEDIAYLMETCFHYSKDDLSIDKPGSVFNDCIRVFRKSAGGSAILIYDTYISHRRRECIKVDGKDTTVEEIFYKFMYRKFGDAFLEDYTEKCCLIAEKRQALQEALEKQKLMISNIKEQCTQEDEVFENPNSYQESFRL